MLIKNKTIFLQAYLKFILNVFKKEIKSFPTAIPILKKLKPFGRLYSEVNRKHLMSFSNLIIQKIIAKSGPSTPGLVRFKCRYIFRNKLLYRVIEIIQKKNFAIFAWYYDLQ